MIHEHCDACGFEGVSFDDRFLLKSLRDQGEFWRSMLEAAGPELRVRPEPLVWSSIEYAAHTARHPRSTRLWRGAGTHRRRTGVSGDLWRPCGLCCLDIRRLDPRRSRCRAGRPGNAACQCRRPGRDRHLGSRSDDRGVQEQRQTVVRACAPRLDPPPQGRGTRIGSDPRSVRGLQSAAQALDSSVGTSSGSGRDPPVVCVPGTTAT